MKAYVINLDHRPDRYSAFQERVGSRLPWASIERVSGILGKDLVLNDAFMARVTSKYRTPELANWMRANMGCTLSHVSCWRRIANSNRMGLVFEDDARLFSSASARYLQRLLDTVPADAGLIFLNDYNRPDWRADLRTRATRSAERLFGRSIANRFDATVVSAECWLAATTATTIFRRWDPTRLKSTEAYAITPELAAKAAEYVDRNLGAIDIQIQEFFASDPIAVGYELTPPMFFQADRRDSDIRDAP